jgi:hypothetical protein
VHFRFAALGHIVSFDSRIGVRGVYLQEMHPRWLRGLRVRGFLAGVAAAVASAFILDVRFQEGPARAGDKRVTFSERAPAEARGRSDVAAYRRVCCWCDGAGADSRDCEDGQRWSPETLLLFRTAAPDSQ